MSSLEASTSDKKYLKIVEGSLREEVEKGTPGAVVREWVAGGNSGTKHELVYKQIAGHITGVGIYEGEYEGKKFQSLNIYFDEVDGKVPVVSAGLEGRYATDLMKKLPNVDFKEEVLIRPYAFTPEGEDKEKTGVEVKQKDHTGNFEKKISNHFHKKEGEKWVAVNGYPEPTDEDRMDWKFFYMKAHRFLVQYTRENIIPKFDNEVKREYPTEEINPEDIGF